MTTQRDCMFWQYPNYTKLTEWTPAATNSPFQTQGDLSFALPQRQDTESTNYLLDGDDQVKRPMNSFLLWAKVMRKKLAQENPTMHNAQVSKLLGKVWNDMTSTEKRPFIEKAERLRAVHMKEHPNYRYAPKKRKERRSVQKMISPEVAAAFHNAIFDLRSTGVQTKSYDENFGLSATSYNSSKPQNGEHLDLRTTGRDYLRAEDLALSLHFHQLSQNYGCDNSSAYNTNFVNRQQDTYASCSMENWNRLQGTSPGMLQNSWQQQQSSPARSDDFSGYPSSPESNLSDDIPCVLQTFLDNNPITKQQENYEARDSAILKDFADIISRDLTRNHNYVF